VRSSARLWGHADFLQLWAAHTVTQLGTQVSFVAVPLVAVVTLDASPAQVGVLTAIGSVPALALGLFAGVWVDRLRRRPILVLADLGRAAVLATIPLAALLGVLDMWHLYVALLLVGSMTLFFDVAYRSYLPSLVRREQLVDGNSKLEVSRSAAEIAGPGLAGGLAQIFTAPLAILFDALSFVVSAIFLASIRTTEPRPGSRKDRTERTSGRGVGQLSREAWDGIRALTGNPTVRALVSCTGTITFFNAAIEAVLVLYLVRVLDLSVATVGIIFSVGGVGLLVGALLAGRITRYVPLGTVLICGPLVIGIADLLLPLAGGQALLAVGLPCAAQVLFGLGLPLYRVNEVSLRQIVVPARLVGRVNSGEYFVREGVVPFGALLGGMLGELIGLRTTLAICALGEIAGLLWILFSPLRSLRRHPDARCE
jgi:predicted MFS family arabinose efflux permease